MRTSLLFFVLLVLASCKNGDQETKAQANPGSAQTALAQSANSEAFNKSFGEVLNAYYELKDQFIAEKDSGIVQASRRMLVAADSLKLDELKADTTVIATARTYSMGISAELKGLLGETKIADQRRSFQLVGEQLYDLIRTVHYDGQVIYHFYCSEAFADQGASWLSNSIEVRNPFIPTKMLNCGELKDTIDMRHKQ
jgi:hypothetical protein